MTQKNHYIIRNIGGLSTEDIKDAVAAIGEIHFLDDSHLPLNCLIESSEENLAKLKESLPGVQSFPLRTIPKPETRFRPQP